VIHNENFKNVSIEVENSKIYVYSFDANDGLCASDTVNL
jgi:hypothetical protein